MRLVVADLLQSNDTIAIPRVAQQAVVGMTPETSTPAVEAGIDLIQIVTIDPSSEEFGFEVRIGGTNLITNESQVIHLPKGSIVTSPDQSELLLT